MGWSGDRKVESQEATREYPIKQGLPLLLTKLCIVKAMVFPVVRYGGESWSIKKAECQRIDASTCGIGGDS